MCMCGCVCVGVRVCACARVQAAKCTRPVHTQILTAHSFEFAEKTSPGDLHTDQH